LIDRRSTGLSHPYQRERLIYFTQKEIVDLFITPFRYYHRLSQKNCEPLVREKLVFNVLPGWLWFFKIGLVTVVLAW
jgi:hypothetical protein